MEEIGSMHITHILADCDGRHCYVWRPTVRSRCVVLPSSNLRHIEAILSSERWPPDGAQMTDRSPIMDHLRQVVCERGPSSTDVVPVHRFWDAEAQRVVEHWGVAQAGVGEALVDAIRRGLRQSVHCCFQPSGLCIAEAYADVFGTAGRQVVVIQWVRVEFPEVATVATAVSVDQLTIDGFRSRGAYLLHTALSREAVAPTDKSALEGRGDRAETLGLRGRPRVSLCLRSAVAIPHLLGKRPGLYCSTASWDKVESSYRYGEPKLLDETVTSSAIEQVLAIVVDESRR